MAWSTAAALFFVANVPELAAAASPDAASQAMLARYAASAQERDIVAAVGHLLDYSVLNNGENAPQTARLTQRYGVMLLRAGEYNEATSVLKTALRRTNAAFGELTDDAFHINMNIGYAYGHLGRKRIYQTKYFDRALEILQQRGEHETTRYVTELLNIVGSLADKDGLAGSISTTVTDVSKFPGNEPLRRFDFDYRNSFGRVENYLAEAEELAAKLIYEDKHLQAKVAIVRAKLSVLETADLAKVPMGVRARITQHDVVKRNASDRQQLTTALTALSEDREANAEFIAAANAALLEIAWLDNDRNGMEALCTSGVLDSSAEYPAERLFRIRDDGEVVAPEFSFQIPTNFFKTRTREHRLPRDENGNYVPRPFFAPVCIGGQLMAALINAPTVSIEEIR